MGNWKLTATAQEKAPELSASLKTAPDTCAQIADALIATTLDNARKSLAQRLQTPGKETAATYRLTFAQAFALYDLFTCVEFPQLPQHAVD